MSTSNRLYFTVMTLFISASILLFSKQIQGQQALYQHAFDGKANTNQVIKDEKVRYIVLTPHLIRLEYSENNEFEDRPTFHVLNRSFPATKYKTGINNGWRVIRTSALTFRYKLNSGPFSVENTKVTLNMNGDSLQVHPRWNHYQCQFGKICEAESARLFNPDVQTSTYIRGDWTSNQYLNYTGTGYTNTFNNPGSSIQWQVDKIPASSTYKLYIRYAARENSSDIMVKVDDNVVDTLNFTTTVSFKNWKSMSMPIQLEAGSKPVVLKRTSQKGNPVHIDHIAIVRSSDEKPKAKPVSYTGNLGGWDRGLGNIAGEIPLHDGLLSREGWYLLDDTRTPIWASPSKWVKPRQKPDSYQDTYLFGYGHDYKKALKDFADLTGHPPLLPKWTFGILFSRNHPYGAENFKKEIVPNQHNNDIPLDGLIIDTDFKSPDRWNGWNWSEKLFPEPENFLKWTEEQGLKVALNIHPSINHEDPQFTKADRIAGGLIEAQGECPRWQGMKEPCSVWNWGVASHNQSYFTLHDRFEEQGVDFWWLDWCCDGSRVTMNGLTPDAWINQQYALQMESDGKRGFSLSRIGSKWQNQATTRPGPWAEHRNSIHFTGDTYPTWEMLKFQSYFTAAEGNIGMSYVSHDIGSYHAGGPRSDELSDEMYIRWVQFGTFQPIFRSHGHGKRLPWQFDGKAKKIGAEFMRLRQQLIPYIYTETYRSHKTGIPIVKSMYLNHPDREEAYQFRYQYYFGTELLVAPVAQPGNKVQKQVWLPDKGKWYHFFTHEHYEGDQVATVESPLAHIPVFAPEGAIVAMGPNMDYVGAKLVDPLKVKIFSGRDGSYSLYEDSGEGHQFRNGAYQKTPIQYNSFDSTTNVAQINIGSVKGDGYDGALSTRSYDIEMIGSKKPVTIHLNGEELDKERWSYNRQKHTILISLEDLKTGERQRVKLIYPE